jgi:membrane-bound lytic murein transglycosylase D
LKNYRLTIAAALICAGCAGGAKPTIAPAPGTANDGGGQRVTVSGSALDSVSMATDMTAVADSARTGDTLHISARDVSQRASEVFGDSSQTAAPLAKPEIGVDAPTWDMDVRSYETRTRVEHYVRMFTGSAKERIVARLERGSRYEPMIRAKMREGGIPEDMYYLALIESGFDPNAYSRAAAVGMWQFMTSTARGMGMRVDWWVDERRDPVRSTTMAVRFLRDLKTQLGSLYLAAAAYNGGPGRIARGLSRYADDLDGAAGEDLFFALAEKDVMPRETREYVPQLIAAALIAKEPHRYGMELRPQPPFIYDSVRVGRATPLAAIAAATGSSVAEIMELNPQILRGMTPPRDSFRVRIPIGAAEAFDSAFAALPAETLVAYRLVTSKKGEYPETISSRYGLSVKQLKQYNPKLEIAKKTGRLAAGQSVMVPSKAVVAAAANVPDPAIEIYSSSRRFHVVKRGENLSSIAKKYHTSTKALMSLNGLRRAMIFPGQSLVVAGGRSARPSTRNGRPGVTQAGSARKAKAAPRKLAPSGK